MNANDQHYESSGEAEGVEIAHEEDMRSRARPSFITEYLIGYSAAGDDCSVGDDDAGDDDDDDDDDADDCPKCDNATAGGGSGDDDDDDGDDDYNCNC